MSNVLGRGAAAVALVVIALMYGGDAGRGFVKDDFVWIANSRVDHPGDLVRLIAPGTAGFFRPVVSLTFSIDHALFGLDPIGYGLTNVALLFGCIWMVFLLFKALGLRAGVAIGGALLWALNFHAVNMAVLWISGRTALVLVCAAAAAACAWVRGHRAFAALLAMLAMWSKEEGFMVPAIFTAWAIVDSRDAAEPFGHRVARVLRHTWMLWLVAAFSLAVRAWTGAWTPASAPSFYQYRVDGATLVQNIYQYADRTATTPILVALVFWLAAGRPRPTGRTGHSRLLKGACWLALGLAPTLLLPVRSSLYALFPSIGVVLIVCDFAERAISHLSPAASRRAVAVLVLLLVGLFPVYKARNRRYVREAELSAAVMREVSKIAGAGGIPTVVVIKDARDVRPTAEQAFGALAEQAARLVTDDRVRLWIDPPPADLGNATPPDPTLVSAVLAVENGQVRRVR